MGEKKFEYKYSAPTQEERVEIENIQSQYKPKDEKTASLERLRKIDSKVRSLPVCISLALGVFGLLIFGFGLSMILHWNILAWGIVVSIVGFAVMCPANYLYLLLDKKLREKYSDEILRISGELLNGNEEKL